MIKVIIVSVVISNFIYLGESLDCFHCFKVNYHNEDYKASSVVPIQKRNGHLGLCEDDIVSSNVMTCPTSQHCIFLKMEDPSFTEYLRTCSGGQYHCNQQLPNVNVTDCFTCNTDKCNGVQPHRVYENSVFLRKIFKKK